MNFDHFHNAKLKQIRLANISFEKHIQMLHVRDLILHFKRFVGLCPY